MRSCIQSSLIPILLLASAVSAAAKPDLISATPNVTTVPRYGLLQLNLNLHTDAANPFDPADIDVETTFKSPDGHVFKVAGFLYEPFSNHLVDGSESITSTGKPVWMVRFTPNVPGRWSYHVTATDPTGTSSLPVSQFKVIDSSSSGFIRDDPKDPYYFMHSDGQIYFPVGEDMCWPGKQGTFDFEKWLPDLHKAGGNWIRLWICEENGIEWSAPKNGTDTENSDYSSYQGPGFYNLKMAWRIGRILRLAAENRVNVMLCLDSYSELTTGGYFGEGAWPGNPYNAANGGPCSAPLATWTDPTAIKLYQQRLRYLTSRFGWRTNLFGWEFWNEASTMPTSWMRTMADYMAGKGQYKNAPADPYQHLVSTTYGSPDIWKLPAVGFSMTHSYGEGTIKDWSPVVNQDALQNRAYHKPHFMAEFGIDWRKPDAAYDPDGKGVNLHNGLWSAVTSGDAATAMLWWWDNYVAPENLYWQFTGVSRFVKAVNWNQGVWKPLQTTQPVAHTTPVSYKDLTLGSETGWGKDPEPDVTIKPDGKLTGIIPGTLFSPGKPDLRTLDSFHVHFRQPGDLILHIDQVSSSATLQVSLDGQPVITKHYDAAPPASGTPEYKSTIYQKQYNNYLATFSSDMDVPVPAGTHVITLNVIDGDWMSLAGITLTHYLSSQYPSENIYALGDGHQAILWAQNSAHNWLNVYHTKTIKPTPPSITYLTGLPDGIYTIQWWNTDTGAVENDTEAKCLAGRLEVKLPALQADIAARILPRG